MRAGKEGGAAASTYLCGEPERVEGLSEGFLFGGDVEEHEHFAGAS